MSNIIDSIQLSGTVYTLSAQTSGGGGVPESAFTAYTASTDARIAQDEEVTAAALNDLNETISGISANSTVELTQAEYDALVTAGTVSANTYYIITDASAGDLTQYWTSAQTNSAITEAVSGKQDTLISGTNIKTINNQSLLGSGNIDIQGGGGGKAVSAGTNISITTGETADTINCTLPISADTNTIRINRKNIKIGTGTITTSNLDRIQVAIGDGVTANGIYSFAFGTYAKATNYNTVSMGYRTESNNQYQVSFGQCNVTSSASSTFGDSGNTLFSIGNGTADNARHNAFEVRQNGDVYITSGGTDIKLQDYLGGGGSITIDPSLDSGSTNPVENRVIYNKIDEVEQVTAAGLNALNDALGGLKLVKLTQTQYDNLQTKDSNTLYIIVN